MKTIICILFLQVLTVYSVVRYDNYTLYKVIPKNGDEIVILQSLYDDEGRFDFWNDPVPGATFVNVMASPENKQKLESILTSNNISFQTSLRNIQEVIDKQNRSIKSQMISRLMSRNMVWDTYYDLEGINSWLDYLVNNFAYVTEIIGGHTYQGRQIKGIKISHGSGKRAIFIEGGIHAREWISPATVCYITNQLIHSDDKDIQAAAKDFDWYIFPVTNPDGYVWTVTENRMWRKNKRPFGDNFGVDLNRNWNNNWLVSGASTNSSSDTYAGPGPFSEPETITLSEYISSIGDSIDLYLSFHSFGNLLLLPFGNSTQPYANYHDAMNIGRRAMGALSVRYGTLYKTGNVAEAIYLATGGSIDWVKGHLKVPLVYCYELRDAGEYGFLLPPEQILPTGQEAMDSLIDMIYQARRYGYMNSGNGVTSSIVMIVFALVLIA